MSTKLEELEAREREFNSNVEKQKQQFKEERHRILEEERRKKQSEKENFLEDLEIEIAREYHMAREQARIIVNKAWEHGHSSGFNEVRSYATEFGEWVEEILDIQRNIDY